MIDRLQKNVPCGYAVFAAGFCFFRGKRIPAPVAITGAESQFGHVYIWIVHIKIFLEGVNT